MKLIIFFALVAVAIARPDGLDDLDNVNIDEITSNIRLLKTNANCILDKGSCTKEAKQFKELAPEAVKTSCSNCSDKHKKLISKLIKAVQVNLPEEYAQIKKMYDPEDKRDDELQEFLNKYSA